MNKKEAYEAMQKGYKVCNEYYTPEEYAFINQAGLIEYEDGCIVGNEFSSNWVKYQDPASEFEWSIWVDLNLNPMSDPYLDKLGDGSLLILTNPIRNYQRPEFYPKKEFVPKNHKRTNKKR